MILIIGPKDKLDSKGWDKLEKEAKGIEGRIEEIESRIKVFCGRVERCTGEYEYSLEEYLAKEGCKDKNLNISMTKNREQFSPLSPELGYEILTGNMHIESLTDELPPWPLFTKDQTSHIEKAISVYRSDLQSFGQKRMDLLKEQIQAYRELSELTLVESFVRREEETSKVIIYAIGHYGNMLLKVEHDLADNKPVKIQESEISMDSELSRSEIAETFERESEESNANVYVISHPSKKMHPDVMIYHVIDELRDRYFCGEPDMDMDGSDVDYPDMFPAVMDSWHQAPEREAVSRILIGADGRCLGVFYGDGDLPDEVTAKLLGDISDDPDSEPDDDGRKNKGWMN